ncbi:hypothetical protein MANES_07G133148v8 [Manihot esculenta]|nr:hypothetical protein MANES_07G133148v8 [Manihot esculenta]KAG8651126.1 hypothetical protein MANES_07G133148v8 [Manihot esculenta]
MINYVANEPSVGLFYVQQHTQNAVPNVINLKNNIKEKTHETILHTEDLEDSIAVVRSMKDCGFPIADEMIRDIRASLALMSERQPRRGLLHSATSGFQIGRTRSWGPSTWGHNRIEQESRRTSNYLSSVFKTAKETASNFKWPQFEPKDSMPTAAEKLQSHNNSSELVASASTSSSLPDMESDEQADSMPLPSQAADDLQAEDEQVEMNLLPPKVMSLLENYDEFKADKEAKLEEWLGETGEIQDKLQEDK